MRRAPGRPGRAAFLYSSRAPPPRGHSRPGAAPASRSTAIRPLIPSRPAASLDWQALLRLARPALSPPHRAWLDQHAARLDWPSLLRLADRQGLGPLVWSHLLATPEWGSGAARAHAELEYMRNTQRSLRMAARAMELVDALGQAGIDAIPFKGPFLAAQVYGDLARRLCADIDLLVRAPELDRAERVLEGLGYSARLSLSPTQRRLLVRDTYEFTLSAAGYHPLELHWRVVPRSFAPFVEHERLWEDREVVRAGHQTVRTFSAENLFLVMAMHAAKHGWRRLEGVTALAGILDRRPSLERIRETADRWRIRGQVELAIEVAGVLAEPGAGPPPSPLARGVLDRLESGILPTQVDLLRLHLRTADRLADRVRFLWNSTMTLSPRDIQAVSLPAALTPGYYLLRPFRLVAGALRGKPVG